MSSDDNNNNNLIRSSSLTDRQIIHPTEIQDKVLCEFDDINQEDEFWNDDDNMITTTPTSKWKQSPGMTSPALSTSSQSSGRVMTLLNHEVIQLPAYLERETIIKNNFDQLGKEI